MFSKNFFLVLLLFFASRVYADSKTHFLAIGQGISSPTMTSTINYSNGFNKENPVGVIYQQSFRLTGEFDSGKGSTNGYGLETGMGNGSLGFSLGFFSRDCSGCEGKGSGAVAGEFAGLALGIRVEEELAGVGIILNPNGQNRFGFQVDVNNPDGDNNNITAIGVGYSYVVGQTTFTLDASKRQLEDSTQFQDLILLTPGFSMRFNPVSLSLNYDLHINDQDGSTNKDDIWWGIGFDGGSSWHVAIYGDYSTDLSVVGTFFF